MVAKNIGVAVLLIGLLNNGFTQNASSSKSLNPKAPNYYCEKTFDGKKIREGFKVNDSKYGENRLYEEGKLLAILHFINEEQNGAFTSYYIQNGNLHETGQYKNGKKEGIWKEYNVEGKLLSTKKYKNDEQIE